MQGCPVGRNLRNSPRPTCRSNVCHMFPGWSHLPKKVSWVHSSMLWTRNGNMLGIDKTSIFTIPVKKRDYWLEGSWLCKYKLNHMIIPWFFLYPFPKNWVSISQWYWREKQNLRTTHADDVSIIPACRVAQDHNQHEDSTQQLQDSTELEETKGGGAADGEPNQDCQQSYNHR